MQTIWDILRRTVYICVFIIPIPFGAYTIHNGSSAVVALFSFVLLSFFMPFFYFKSSKSGFGPYKKRVHPYLYWLGWFLVQSMTYTGFSKFNFQFLWTLPSVGRDVSFILIMYWQVLLAILLGFILTRCCVRKKVEN